MPQSATPHRSPPSPRSSRNNQLRDEFYDSMKGLARSLRENLQGAADWVLVEVHPKHLISRKTSLFHAILREPESAELQHHFLSLSEGRTRVVFGDSLVSLRAHHHHFCESSQMREAGREFIRSVWSIFWNSRSWRTGSAQR